MKESWPPRWPPPSSTRIFPKRFSALRKRGPGSGPRWCGSLTPYRGPPWIRCSWSRTRLRSGEPAAPSKRSSGHGAGWGWGGVGWEGKRVGATGETTGWTQKCAEQQMFVEAALRTSVGCGFLSVWKCVCLAVAPCWAPRWPPAAAGVEDELWETAAQLRKHLVLRWLWASLV